MGSVGSSIIETGLAICIWIPPTIFVSVELRKATFEIAQFRLRSFISIFS